MTKRVVLEQHHWTADDLDHIRDLLDCELFDQADQAQDYFTVSICPCRHRKNLDPESPDCKHPTENCLHFGRLGR